MKANPYDWSKQSPEHEAYAFQNYPLISSLVANVDAFPSYAKAVQTLSPSYRSVYITEWSRWKDDFGLSWDKLGCIRENRLGQFTSKYRWRGQAAGSPQSLGMLVSQKSSHLGGWWDEFKDWATTCEPPFDPNYQAELSGPPPGFDWIDEEESNLLQLGCKDWQARLWGYENDVYTGDRYRNMVDGRVYWTLDLMGMDAAERQEYLNEFLLRTGMTQPVTPVPPAPPPPIPPIPPIIVPPDVEPVSPDEKNGEVVPPVVGAPEKPWYKKLSLPVIGVVGGLGAFALIMMKKGKKRSRRR